ncbi:SRPBCC family protein [Streptomyces sp. NPDC001812]|uniref:SRPBCC family protein n=1 Tax=unclassified Streptomyces TaxID=2593676 RepID=UPI0036697D4D
MDRNHYRFRSLWTLPAPAPAVYRALERVEDYPRWWPQVKEVTRLADTAGGGAGILRIRSVLPFSLVATVRETRRDPAAGILEVALSGDIDGWARWTVVPRGSGTTLARYAQEVDVRTPLLRRLARPGRPVFRANHALMMRAGRRGLAAHLQAV